MKITSSPSRFPFIYLFIFSCLLIVNEMKSWVKAVLVKSLYSLETLKWCMSQRFPSWRVTFGNSIMCHSMKNFMERPGIWICNTDILFYFIFFLFLATPWHMEFPGLGSHLSHSCDLCCNCGSNESLNPLCQAWDPPCVLALQSWHQSHWTTVGTPHQTFLRMLSELINCYERLRLITSSKSSIH